MNPAALVRGPATINVDLPPAALAAPAAGVASALSKRLLRWCPDLGGVLLSYGSVELLGSHSGKREGKNSKGEGAEEGGNNSAEISDYFGFVRVAAAVGDALVFAPCPGMRLEGTVARVGGDYVGVLALGVFSAAVGGAALSGRFDLEDVEVEEEEAVEEEVEAAAAADEAATKTSKTSKKKKTVTTMKKAWVCRADRSHRLVEGARVLFDVARVRRSDGGFVSITGSLESGSSGVVGAQGVGAAAASPAPASASAPAAKKSKSTKSGIPSAAPTPASAAANGSSKRKKAEAGSAEKKKEPKKKEKEKEPEAKKAKTSSKKK